MNRILQELSKREKVLTITGVFFIFVIGFFIFYGKQASQSGSWKYVIDSPDEYSYWAYAKGASESPRSDGNPFYFEEIGKGSGALYPVCFLTGLLAKFFHIQVMTFFPIWHIGMPFGLWLSLYFCFFYFWKYPPGKSAVFALVFLGFCLYLRGLPPDILFRFSRPGDGLWLVFPVISWIMNVDPQKPGLAMGMGGAGFILCWLGPFWIPLLGVVAGLEWTFQKFMARDSRRSHLIFISGLFLLAGVMTYFLSLLLNSKDCYVFNNHVVIHLREHGYHAWLIFMLVGAGILFFGKLLHQKWTTLDRITFYLFLMEPVCGTLFPAGFQFSSHRYYFFILQIAALTGWLIEKIPKILEQPRWLRLDPWWGAGLALVTLGIVTHSEYSFLRYGVKPDFIQIVEDNSLLLLALLPAITLWVWIFFRFETVRKILRRGVVVPLVVFLIWNGFSEYSRLVTRVATGPFPFDGAYQWLNRNAQKKDVVLTVPPERLSKDYLILYTDQKSYIQPYGEILARGDRNRDNEYRFLVYMDLLTEDIRRSNYGPIVSMPDKLRHCKLDYILVDRPSPFGERIREQLAGYIQEVYRDERCLLWRVRVP